MDKITILGGGLVGSLLSIYLSNHGHKVQVLERRDDPRISGAGGGRSINLALSDRGFKGLVGANKELFEQVINNSIPMTGRMIHDEEGNLSLQPYGKEGQNIYSVSRSLLNEILIDFAKEKSGVEFQFNQRTINVDLVNDLISIENPITGLKSSIKSSLTFGADGAYSTLRYSLQKNELFNYSQSYLEYGYKELSIPAGENQNHLMEKNALHIWPRKSFMLIALPNLDGSFTCTLFLPFKGENSFESLKSEKDVESFFHRFFPDAVDKMPDHKKDFFSNPTSSLVTIKCFPWSFKGKFCLIGDAAHAIVPFYGQGMNAGFEDCTILNEILKVENDWAEVFTKFQESRKKDCEAIAELAVRNFEEMRDLVVDENFLLRKKIEGRLHKLFPTKWIPLYTMVTFSHIPYSEALRLAKLQDEIMKEVLDLSGIQSSWENLDFEALVKKYVVAQKQG